MKERAPPPPAAAAANVTWQAGLLTREQRWKWLGHKGATLWLTGLSGAGKSTLSAALEYALVSAGVPAYRLDGDNVRHGLSANLGFSAADRAENIRRVGEVARLFADSGTIALASFISPYRVDRAIARQMHEQEGLTFLEVYLDTPLEVCEQRDPKGLYQKARRGLIRGFTGIDDPYEAPERPELTLYTAEHDVQRCAQQCLQLMAEHGLAPDPG
jgi:adenylylsulfate kinase